MYVAMTFCWTNDEELCPESRMTFIGTGIEWYKEGPTVFYLIWILPKIDQSSRSVVSTGTTELPMCPLAVTKMEEVDVARKQQQIF